MTENKETTKNPNDLEIGGIIVPESSRQPCEIWTRVMGYHRPVSEFNIGKKSEFAARKNFKIKDTNNES